MDKIEPWRPTIFFYPTEYNVYSGEGVFSSYRLAYGVAQKKYFIYNHLGSKAVEVDSIGNIIDYVQYSPFGEPLKKNNYQPQWNERLGYIDKEKDRESKLGDHTSTSLSAGGVRKYDYEIGRFTSVDPLWEKYIGWTGYQYTRNNSINRIDYNGMDDGQFGSWMQVGPIQELILGDKNVNTYQETIENSDKPVNKQLINAWAEIGLMGLTGVATDVALSAPFATKYLSTASNYIKGLLGFGDDAVKGGEKIIIHFGKTENQINHAFRHTDELGLDRSLVQSIVERHFKPLSTKVVTGEPFNRIIEIGGKRIQYTAFKLPDGTFNIGRIHGVK